MFRFLNIYKNYFELLIAAAAFIIILIAIIMDRYTNLYMLPCPMCILTRYIFGLVAISALLGFFIRKNIFSKGLIIIPSLIGIGVTSRQIYIQNLPIEKVLELKGCGMPFNERVISNGLFDAIQTTLQGGPSCAEDGWRFILNFAEWGLLFFAAFIIFTLFSFKNSKSS